ncbi:MAG: methyltransferase domain-containing protein [Selenomonadaceae bacterium]|nr:methyltransferase domain-containing protein [Selenomonadaceae bacterium]
MMQCRCCNATISGESLIEYKNMPKSAQFFPDETEAREEKGAMLSLYQCPYCGMLQLGGEPVSYFRDVIRATDVSEEMRRFREEQFADWVRRHSLKGKKVLEVGCGTGGFLACMEKAGAVAIGMEHGRDSIRTAQKRGLKVFEQYPEREDETFEGAPYDGFFIMNFLEHIPEPKVFLRAIANNLTEEAYGIVEVPNTDMILEKSLYSELIQDHLLYFREDTLRRLLELSGFEVLDCRAIWHDYILSAEVRKRRRMDVSSFVERRLRTKKACDDFFQRMRENGKQCAVWGAGHQALANLSLLDMKPHIVCVIDSADFKQNKLTPATHIPIVNPKILDEGEIGAILIMAGSYSEEIRSIVNARYPAIQCAILRENGMIDETVFKTSVNMEENC